MRKLTMLGLSLILSVGAYASPQLAPAKAQKRVASTEKTEQTHSLNVKLKGNDRIRARHANTPGVVEQRQGKSRALITSRLKSKSKAPVTTDKIFAGLVFAMDGTGGGRINPATGVYTQIYSGPSVHVIGMNPDFNEIYSVEFEEGWGGVVYDIFYRTYDATTGAVKVEKEIASEEDFNLMPQHGAYVYEENAIYGYSTLGWVKLDCATFKSTLLNQTDEFPFGLAYNSNTKQLVALVYNENTGGFGLAVIDKETGAVGTPTWVEGATTTYFGGFAYDYSSDSYLYNPNDDLNSYIYAIDATTHAVTEVCRLPGFQQTGAMYVDEVKPSDPLSPKVPTFVSASFPNGSLTGTVTFAMPSQNVDKGDLTGQVTYTIKVGDTEVGTGTAAPGAEVTANYTATASGLVTFTCVASQETHFSREASQEVYIGNDVPCAPANVHMTPITVTWDPVTTGIHDGYIQPGKMTYSVSINGNVVAENITATTCPTNLPVSAELDTYVASVTATCNGLTSEPGNSNDVTFGQPFNEPVSLMPSPKQANLFTLIDHNQDDNHWSYNPTDEWFSCGFNGMEAMDDYLILPPILIKDADMLHHFWLNAWRGSRTYDEKIEVYIGKEPTVEAMTTKVMDTTVITGLEAAKQTPECYFMVPEAGRWYIAVKGVSDPNMLRLYVNNFNLEVSDVAAKGPAAVENVTLVPGAEGELKATVNFTLPTVDNRGNALTGQVSATVEDDVDYKTVTGAPGSAQSVEILTIQGTNDVIIQTMQGDVLGFPISANVYTGVEIPAEVTDFNMTPSESNYGITVTFGAPEAGINGGYINKADLTYGLYQNQPVETIFGTLDNWVKIFDFGHETAITGELLPVGSSLGRYELGVAAENVAGAGTILYTSLILGEPFKMPVIEDFTTGEVKYQPLMLNSAGGMIQEYKSVTGLANIDPKFATEGPAMLGRGGENQFGYFFLPPISTKGADKAAFELKYYVGACKNVTVYAETYGVPQKEIFNESYLYGYPDGFQTLPISLPAEFQDKDWVNITIRVDFSADKQYFVWTGYRMINMVQKDMAALDVKAPKKVATGKDYDVIVNVANYGLSEAKDYSVQLYANGEKIAEKTGADLASFADGQVVFPQSMSPIATESIEYYGKVIQTGDANEANNETAVITVSPRQSSLPGATELTAADSDNTVALTWNEPDLTAVTPDPVTDDFEDADAFSSEYGDWVFVDVDDSPVGGFQGMDIPGITSSETKGSFWIWDQSQLGNQTFAAHSGTKYLFALYRADGAQSDEWAISPQLCGDAQSISFWAKSYSGDYPEKIEVYYSTGSTDPKDFTLIEGASVSAVPAEWTEYTVELPAGATRFAIRSCATNTFMLMVDDVTYTPAAEFTGEVSLKGYDVYRDGVKLNDALVENTAYADANVVKGTEYKYVVVAVFEEGSGRVSNTATIVYGQSGLDGIEAAQAIATAKNMIVVRGFEGQNVTVSTADGKVVANGKAASDSETISVPAGVYVVKAGTKSAKVIVK